MQSENRILGNQLVVMSREDLDALVNEMAQNIVAAQTKNAQNDYEAWMSVPEGERFIILCSLSAQQEKIALKMILSFLLVDLTPFGGRHNERKIIKYTHFT